MPDTPQGISSEGASARNVDTIGWGLLLIWVGTVLLLHWGWALGLVGAGAIVLGVQAWRRHLGLRWERFAMICGVVLVASGAWSLLGVAIGLVPLLCIAGGIALVASAWTARRRSQGRPPDLHAPSHPRA